MADHAARVQHLDAEPVTARLRRRHSRRHRIIAITGGGDSNTQPIIAIDYVKRLTARGLDARYVEVPGASHNAVTRSNEFFAAIDTLLK